MKKLLSIQSTSLPDKAQVLAINDWLQFTHNNFNASYDEKQRAQKQYDNLYANNFKKP